MGLALSTGPCVFVMREDQYKVLKGCDSRDRDSAMMTRLLQLHHFTLWASFVYYTLSYHVDQNEIFFFIKMSLCLVTKQ